VRNQIAVGIPLLKWRIVLTRRSTMCGRLVPHLFALFLLMNELLNCLALLIGVLVNF
jgi:hypothetical protein